MKSLGAFMFFMGLGSILLSFFEYEFVLLMWIDNWGAGVAWLIRIGLIIGGGLIYLRHAEE